MRIRPTYIQRQVNFGVADYGLKHTTEATIRHHLLQRAGRLPERHGKLTLTMHPNPAVTEDLPQFLEALKNAA